MKIGRPPLPSEKRKVTVPLRLYPHVVAAIRGTGKGMQAWIEAAVYEKLKHDRTFEEPHEQCT